MTSDPAPLKREVYQLVDQQIQTLKQRSTLSSSQLLDYRNRSQKIRLLYTELDRIGRARIEALAKAS